MVRGIVNVLCVALFAALAPVALAQDFSADLVSAKQGGPSKVYSTKDKIRFDVEGKNEAMGPMAMIIDEANGKLLMLMASRRMYMDSVPAMMRTPLMSQFWHVEDVNDACPQWKKAAEQLNSAKNWGSCTKVGSETVNGRSTVKYEGLSTNGQETTVWVDTKLHCPIKTDASSGGMELRNIQEGSQPASLFEVPAGYTRFDMGAMMGQQPR